MQMVNYDDKIIEIVYTCTGGYVNYAELFLNSLKYFFPSNRKIVRIISDDAEKWKGFLDENIIYTEVISRPTLLYPCVPIHKMYWINEIPRTNADYIFYFDADTIFKEVPNYNWNRLFKKLDEGEVMISKHPVYISNNEAMINSYLPYFFSTNTDRNPQNASYIEDEVYTYVITSFFGANNIEMHRICNEIVSLQKEDMIRTKPYWIPMFIDENYFNKLVCNFEKGRSNNFIFSVEQYNEMYDSDNKECDTVFMYQKNMKDYKFNRR